MSVHDKDVSHKEEFNISEDDDFPVDKDEIVQKYIQVPLNVNDTKIKNKLSKDDLYRAIIELHLQKEASDKRVKDLEKLQLKKANNSEADNLSDEYETFVKENKKVLPDTVRDPIPAQVKVQNSSSSPIKESSKDLQWDQEAVDAFIRSQTVNPPKPSFPEPNLIFQKNPTQFTQLSEPKKILKLDPNTPKFHGNHNEDVDDWLYKIKINLIIASIPEDRYLDFLTNYCISKAGVYLRRLRESYSEQRKILTWNELRAHFIKRYRPVDHIRRVRNQLISVKQNNSVQDYIDNFMSLVNQIGNHELT